ncbi:MAG: hypothetical protein JWQ10_349 [Herbaspirillum sp.]|jgi:hypothetical protein|nr:hypothetical protein [Herbaspirillum sp.]
MLNIFKTLTSSCCGRTSDDYDVYKKIAESDQTTYGGKKIKNSTSIKTKVKQFFRKLTFFKKPSEAAKNGITLDLYKKNFEQTVLTHDLPWDTWLKLDRSQFATDDGPAFSYVLPRSSGSARMSGLQQAADLDKAQSFIQINDASRREIPPSLPPRNRTRPSSNTD